MATCNCMGPQRGEPLCPCQMRAVQGWRGAENWGPYATGRSATQQSARKLLPEAPDPSEFRLTLREDRPATIDEHRLLRSEIEQLQAALDWARLREVKLTMALEKIARSNTAYGDIAAAALNRE